MELRAFAEQVLFATTLDEKLRPPEGVLTDEHPGPAIVAPASPGRPAGLGFKPPEAAPAGFPGLHQLEQERERGRLLHFFANHELLATELMALVLLRFPAAPAAFRRGVLQTLKDEQDHTRFYLGRMAACGTGFGELPVSGYFWRAVAPMENPIDYVAGLSLTFEQANLDYCRHFAQGFARVGDGDTAVLLERIYRDEIAHVAYGLKWFRRWKQPGASDWEAFCRLLRFPLSPQRAKGFGFNIEGRRAAGLDPEFIAHLDVYSLSKGRTPTVWWFNPLAEGRLARGTAFQPTRLQAELAGDLENLPQFLARQDDVVLVRRLPGVAFLSSLKQAGFPLPEFAELPASTTEIPPALAGRKLGRLRPWAWAPDSLERLRPLFPQVTGDARQPEDCHSDRQVPLFSKAWSARLLRELLHAPPTLPEAAGATDWLCPESAAGTPADSLPEVLEAVAAIRRTGHHRVVVKESFSLAGQGALRLWEPELLENQRRWLESATRDGRTVVVEPWMERGVDFSLQLEMEPSGLRIRGWTGLVNDRKGQFVANWVEPDAARRPPAAVQEALGGSGAAAAGLRLWFDALVARLAPLLREHGFLGPLGIDAFTYHDSDGRPRVKPVVEINPRHTMGRLALELMRHTSPGSYGVFRIVNAASLRHAGIESFPAYASLLRSRHPVERLGEPVGRLHGGAVCLGDPDRATAALAVFHVGRSLPSVLAQAGLPGPATRGGPAGNASS